MWIRNRLSKRLHFGNERWSCKVPKRTTAELSVGCRGRPSKRPFRSHLFHNFLLTLLAAWRFQQGVSFAPVARTGFFPRHRTSATSLRDTEDPIIVNTVSSSISSATLNSTQTESSLKSTSTVSVPLRMPTGMPNSKTNNNQRIKNNKKTNSKYFVPAEDLARLQDSIDLVALIECYGIPQFTKSGDGSRASCLCPFHDDHNPSLKIDGGRGIFKCFSCGVGGNALSFVREYAKIHGTELSFLEAVKILDDMATDASSAGVKPVLPLDIAVPMGARPPARNATKSANVGTKKDKATTTTSRQRVLLANLHAAAYFEECLQTRLDAGAARAHLRNRKINAATVKTFAIGFAPETYFGITAGQAWGEGSLVHYLRDLGFSPQEIIDAGLAIRTKRGKQQLEEIQEKINSGGGINEKNATAAVENDYSTLMDRFRGRLVVPIFDATGSHVLGFGGRILESVTSGSDFKAAKYLNSPESVVFQKKEVLFGKHLAEKSTSTTSKSKLKEVTRPRSLIVVEGYMDAISMWQAGIRETVASMGTAISLEQLQSAASAARKLGVGKVVLCLDNDDAGVAAVERLCSGQDPLLLSATASSNVEIYVAQLPAGVKDPAEYLEANSEDDGVGLKFRNEVIENAREWTEWYIERLADSFRSSSQDNDDQGGFSATFDRLASFLSVFEESDQRAVKASYISKRLAPLLDGDIGKGEYSMTSSQLESDLLHKASISSRTVALQTQSSFEISDSSLISNEIRPFGVALPQSLEISQDLTEVESPKGSWMRKDKEEGKMPSFESLDNTRGRNPRSKRKVRMKWPKSKSQEQKAMTPHVGSLQPGPLDDSWLRGSLEKAAWGRDHLRYEISVEGSRIGKFKKYIGPETTVRFNHNQYHGTWSSPEASMAGYTTSGMPKNLDFLTRGTSSLVEVSKEDISTVAEDMLLRLLLRYDEARRSLRESLRVSQASRSTGRVHWSRPEKEWLFKCIIEEKGDIFSEKDGADQLLAFRSRLLSRSDCIQGALGDIPEDGDSDNDYVDEEKSEVDSSVEKTESSNMAATATVQRSNSLNFVPSIGDEWMDFAEMEGCDPELGMDERSFPAVTDDYLDSLPVMSVDEDSEQVETTSNKSSEYEMMDVIVPEKVEDSSETDTPETLDAVFVATDVSSSSSQELIEEGVLDYLFCIDNNDLDLFSGTEFDEIATKRGDDATKAAWAAQDLYTILQTTSVLHRVQAGRTYMLEQETESANGKGVGIVASKRQTMQIMNEAELAEYCSPNCTTGGLRDDLHLARTLIKANQRAKKRIHSLILAGFADHTAITRGYSWLNNVLRFNDMKMMQWNDIVEAKEGFKLSDERLEDLEEIVGFDWNELSDHDEMWEWNKNVNLDHVSHIAQKIQGDKNPETMNDVLDRIEEEWDWAIGDMEDDEDMEEIDGDNYDAMQGADEGEMEGLGAEQDYYEELEDFVEDYDIEIDE